jgi:hypothetical protein
MLADESGQTGGRHSPPAVSNSLKRQFLPSVELELQTKILPDWKAKSIATGEPCIF